MILILTNKWDISADFVVKELSNKKHPFVRLNTEDLVAGSASVFLPEMQITVSKMDKTINLNEDINVIWNRRPGKPFDDIEPENRPTVGVQRFVNDQWYSWMEALRLIPNLTWINHPAANEAMESKIRQLRLASILGFRVPNTLVTNDPDEARSFLKDVGGKAIVKALYSPLIEEKDQDYFIFTNMIEEINAERDEQIRLSPCIFQEPIMPKVDYRVTVVGDSVIAAKIVIRSMDGPTVDWRTVYDGIDFIPCQLPKKIEKLCRNYVKEAGLIFGAIDLVEKDNEHIFLEINPNGEWGWLQKPVGLPIAETLASLMIAYDVK